MIIDAHAHIFPTVQGNTGSGPTRSLDFGKIQVGDQVVRALPASALTTVFPPEMLLDHLEWAGVDRAVLLQGPFYGVPNEYLATAVRRWPDRFVAAAYLDPPAPNPRGQFTYLVEELGFRIFKFEMSVGSGLVGLYPDLRLDGPEMSWIWEQAEERGLVITLDLGSVGSASYQTDAVAAIIGRHPDLKIVIAHLGQPPMGQRGDRRLDRLWEAQVRLAEHANVWMDLAALPVYAAGEEYPFPSAGYYLRRAVDMVGAEKLMLGTDLPGVLHLATYPQHVQYIKTHLAYLPVVQRNLVLGETALQVYWQR
jgi:predicted TIM-barrel fold metal-dependent hydrolase